MKERSFDVVRADTTVLHDADTPLKGINNYDVIAPDTLVLTDGSGSLFILRGDLDLERVGMQGDAPCTYRSPAAFSYDPPILTVADRNRAQLLTFDLRTLECLGEYSDPAIRNFSGLAQMDGTIYGLRSGLTSSLEDDTPMLYAVGQDSVATLPLTKGMVPAQWFQMPILFPTTLRADDGFLYFVQPFSTDLTRFNVASGAVSNFSLRLESPVIQDASDPMALMQALNRDTDLVFGLDLLDDVLAVTSKRGQGDSEQWTVRFYNRSDFAFLGEIPTEDRVIAVDENRILTLHLTLDDEEPYRLIALIYE